MIIYTFDIGHMHGLLISSFIKCFLIRALIFCLMLETLSFCNDGLLYVARGGWQLTYDRNTCPFGSLCWPWILLIKYYIALSIRNIRPIRACGNRLTIETRSTNVPTGQRYQSSEGIWCFKWISVRSPWPPGGADFVKNWLP